MANDTASVGDPRARLSGVHVVVTVGAVMLQMAATVGVGLSFLNAPVAKALGVGQGQVLLYFALFQLTAGASMIFLGSTLLKRLGVRNLAAVAGGWTALCLVGMGFTGSLPMLYALGAGLGLLLSAGTQLVSNVLVTEWFVARRGLVLGLVSGLGGLGAMMLGVIMPLVLAQGGWRAGFWALAVYVVALTAIPAFVLIRPRPRDVELLPYGGQELRPVPDLAAPVAEGVPRGRAFRSRSYWLIAFGLLCTNIALGIHQHLVPLGELHGVDLTRAGLLVSTVALGITMCSPLLGVLGDRIGVIGAFWVALASLAGAQLVFLVAHGFVPLVLGGVLLSLGTAGPIALAASLVIRTYGPRDFAGLLAPMLATMPLGSAIGVPLWGSVVDATGRYDAAQIGSAVGVGIGAVALHLGFVLGRRLHGARA